MYLIRLDSKFIVWGLVDSYGDIFHIGMSKNGFRPAREYCYYHYNRGDKRLIDLCGQVRRQDGLAGIEALAVCPSGLMDEEKNRWLLEKYYEVRRYVLPKLIESRPINKEISILKQLAKERRKKRSDPFGLNDIKTEKQFSWGA